jgi:ATP-dependent DNA helicase RecG
VLHLTLSKTREVIYASNGKAYIRRGAQSLPIEGDEVLQRLKYDKGISSFEDELVDADLNTITNSSVIIDFLLRVVPSAEPDVWLEKQHLIVRKRPTVAGILLFAEEPQAILAKRSAIKVYRYKTKAEEGERDYLFGDPLTVEGPMYELIYGAVDRTKEIIEGIEKLGVEGLQKIQYPSEALHEIITNAVLHRDYSIPADVQVRIFDNRVEIESPGKLPGHVTPANILKEQFARNPKVVRLINKFPDPPNKDVGEGLNEPPRVSRRLQSLRGWGHGETRTVFPGSAGASGADGGGARGGPSVAVGGDHLDRDEARVLGGDAPELGAAGRARRRPAAGADDG